MICSPYAHIARWLFSVLVIWFLINALLCTAALVLDVKIRTATRANNRTLVVTGKNIFLETWIAEAHHLPSLSSGSISFDDYDMRYQWRALATAEAQDVRIQRLDALVYESRLLDGHCLDEMGLVVPAWSIESCHDTGSAINVIDGGVAGARIVALFRAKTLRVRPVWGGQFVLLLVSGTVVACTYGVRSMIRSRRIANGRCGACGYLRNKELQICSECGRSFE